MPITSFASAAGLELWQVTPYRVRIFAAFENNPALPPAVQKNFCVDLLARIDGVVGAPWDAAVAPAPKELRRAMLHSWDDITVVQAAQIAENNDKIMFLAVKTENGALSAAVREFDVRTQQIGPPAVRAAWHLGKLRDAALDALLAAFSPLANIESVDIEKRTTILHLKAAGLPSRDPALKVIQSGMIFRPYIRLNNYDGTPRRVTPQAWTFLVVDKAAPERLDCRIESGLSVPLNAKRRARMEQLALAIHPPKAASVLALQSRTEPKVPLPGYEVLEIDKEANDAAFLGRSDWQGRVVIRPTEKTLRFFLVKYGGELLARFPLVPGLEPIVTAEIRNGDYRLQAEGFVIGLQEELVDLFAQRELLRKGALMKIDAGELDRAKALCEELDRLADGRTFLLKLAEERKKLDTKDAVVQAQIDKLFADTRKLVEQCLDEKVVEQLAQELRDAKQSGAKKQE
ncbi:MAG: hypothetical protein IT426_01400 [Pirellulales bacterium]|nr:hypothetical protein [Pirellulales bacterium]